MVSSVPHIRILHADALDKDKWDACIAGDPRALIYSCSWYLDAMADDWYAVVAGDYSAVMPLPVKRKWSVRMIVVPPFVQRLGIAGLYDAPLETAIRSKALSFCKLIRYVSSDKALFPHTSIKQRTNFILPLLSKYEQIAAAYTAACRKNINKAISRQCVLADDVAFIDVVRLYQAAYGGAASYTAGHYLRLQSMLHTATQKGRCHIAGVMDEAGILVYAGILLDDGKRLYYILGAPTDKGRHMRATYFFIDAMIRRFAGSGKILDFEGSDIPAVAQFYQAFSPHTEHYYDFYLNQYPVPVKEILNHILKPF